MASAILGCGEASSLDSSPACAPPQRRATGDAALAAAHQKRLRVEANPYGAYWGGSTPTAGLKTLGQFIIAMGKAGSTAAANISTVPGQRTLGLAGCDPHYLFMQDSLHSPEFARLVPGVLLAAESIPAFGNARSLRAVCRTHASASMRTTVHAHHWLEVSDGAVLVLKCGAGRSTRQSPLTHRRHSSPPTACIRQSQIEGNGSRATFQWGLPDRGRQCTTTAWRRTCWRSAASCGCSRRRQLKCSPTNSPAAGSEVGRARAEPC